MINLWYYKNGNAGDEFGAYILKKLGIDFAYNNKNREFISCGSILQVASEQSKVWGSGFHNEDNETRAKIDNMYAVRGKLTYAKLHIKKKITLGDPGLLASALYKPKTTKKYAYGIISHYIDYNEFKKFANKDVPVINMRTSNIEDLLDRINECNFIFSSSLHGIIFAHSLGIPAVHIENKPLISKNNFKFKDYYSVFKKIKYKKIKFNGDFMFVADALKMPKDLLCPSEKEVKEIQRNLMEAFPYRDKIKNRVRV